MDLGAGGLLETTRRVQVNGCGIHLTVYGAMRRQAGSGRALVCLHGGPGVDGSGLRLMLPALADAADVIIPDQRGHPPRNPLGRAASPSRASGLLYPGLSLTVAGSS
jgi:pimeloyl-ACP methyl ester carboxylesterase